ncbi:hypothetical protein MSAN_01551900 [Mycena sanguinolenta]|uniref:Uncharacterized protein n=1 Tax=Mycena sanguinolenta TaxID=230812 RepID=A0A8H7CXP8_9AGAR|nr:hypothetical protein MSAN_01551900 [Mycena sanguinolenta]
MLLTPGPNPDANLCPTLQELVIKNCADTQTQGPVLHAFIQWRVEFGQGFRRLRIEDPWDRDDSLSEEELQSYGLQGLDISIICTARWGPSLAPPPWTGLLLEDIEPK